MQKQTGFYLLKSSNPKIKDSVAYHCNNCAVSYIFGDNKPRAYCCNQWVTPTQKFLEELPVVQSATLYGPQVLRGNVIDFEAGAEEANQQEFSSVPVSR